MTSLHEIQGLNKFCGPAVIATMTGLSTDECAIAIQSISGKREIKAVEVRHLVKAFEKLRFKVEEQKIFSYTLFGVLNELAEKDGLFFVLLPNHFVAIEVKENKVYLCDNHSKSPINAASSARLTQTVSRVYKVTAKDPPIWLRSEITVEVWIGNITIKKFNIYKNPEDNTEFKMGHIYYKSDEEMQELIKKLNEIPGVGR